MAFFPACELRTPIASSDRLTRSVLTVAMIRALDSTESNIQSSGIGPFGRGKRAAETPHRLHIDGGALRSRLRDRLSSDDRAIMDRRGLYIAACYLLVAMLLIALTFRHPDALAAMAAALAR
jgi:hypothetical protein